MPLDSLSLHSPSISAASLHRGRLRRLPDAAYRGRSVVHWSMTVDGRSTGWLTERLHARLREAILHVCARFEQACPVYCLMPDHGHFLLMGLSGSASGKGAVQMLRREWNAALGWTGHSLQRQAYEHVLTRVERMEKTFQAVAQYVLENPVRGGVVDRREEWPFAGCLVPGYPSLDPEKLGFWSSFWLAYAAVAKERGDGESEGRREKRVPRSSTGSE